MKKSLAPVINYSSHSNHKLFSPLNNFNCYPVDPYLIAHELLELCSENETQNIDNLIHTYLPLTKHLYCLYRNNLTKKIKPIIQLKPSPFIISITGSVAVGKSTTSRIIKKLLSYYSPKQSIQIINTDGFLYNNQTLKERGLMSKKGFPESYNQELMLNTLKKIKENTGQVSMPLYSHEHYDIIPNGRQTINQPDILIIEGLNLSKPPSANTSSNFSHYIHQSIYIHAEHQIIKQWYVKRFMSFREQAKYNNHLYFNRFKSLTHQEAIKYAQTVWSDINELNLNNNILPYKYNADIILSKNTTHDIKSVEIKCSSSNK